MRTNISADKKMWTEGDIQWEPHIGIKSWHQQVDLLSFFLRGIYLLNTLTKLFEGLMEARLSKFTEFNDTLTPCQQGSRITRQTHYAIYALIATVQERPQYGFPSYCCFINFATAYPSVHRERLGLKLKNDKITGKIWHLLKENSRSVRVRVLHALINQNDEVDIVVLPQMCLTRRLRWCTRTAA